jgi:hypothetical protein
MTVVDVCKQHLEVCLEAEHQRVTNDAGRIDAGLGFASLLQATAEHGGESVGSDRSQ